MPCVNGIHFGSDAIQGSSLHQGGKAWERQVGATGEFSRPGDTVSRINRPNGMARRIFQSDNRTLRSPAQHQFGDRRLSSGVSYSFAVHHLQIATLTASTNTGI